MKETITDGQIKYRLEAWATWYHYDHDGGLGYPKKSVEARLKESGGVIVRSTTVHYPPDNPDAEQINCFINEMKQQNHQQAQALKEYYIGSGTVVEKAKRMRLSRSHFNEYVHRARQWLAGRLRC